MSHLDSSKHILTNSCYSRRLEEVFTEDYPKEIEQDQNRKPGKGERQEQSPNQEPKEGAEIKSQESELSKIKPRVQDCGLNQSHSKRIEGT